MTEAGAILVDRYQIVRRITQHGSSATYEARDRTTQARVVVKELSVGGVVREGAADLSYDGDDFTKLIDLFEREARVLAHLDHPGIPAFIDHFRLEVEGDTRLYNVQELIEGNTLGALVEGGRHFTEAEAIDLCRDIVDVLDYLHDRSPPLIHRDIKPDNIIVGRDGAVHLVDFGSVRNVRDVDGLDGKTIVGTYGYMPIEQYEARAVPQSDFYALGMTLVFLLSHKNPTLIPRRGMTLEFRKHVHVSERFAGLIEWMIQPAPEDRPSSASVILGALDPKLRNLPDLPTSRSPVAEDARAVAMSARRTAALLFGVLGLIVALLGFLRIGGLGVSETSLATPSGSPRVDRPPPVDDLVPVSVVDGVLTIDLDQDFEYVAIGWPMGRSVAQTTLPALSERLPDGLTGPAVGDGVARLYGAIPLGNRGHTIDYVLVEEEGSWSLHVDSNGNRDLSDDGPGHANEGSGPLLATELSLSAPVRLDSGEEIERPYDVWIWFTQSILLGRVPSARMYARHHYRGSIKLDGDPLDATVFEFRDHDALYQHSGVCIDLDRDAKCEESDELFHDGDVLWIDGSQIRIRLAYP